MTAQLINQFNKLYQKHQKITSIISEAPNHNITYWINMLMKIEHEAWAIRSILESCGYEFVGY